MRKLIYEAPVLEDKNEVISVTLNVFLLEIGRLFGTDIGEAPSRKPLPRATLSPRKSAGRP
jgi:hypothetical protein